MLLARLAREGGGNFYYVEAPAQIADFFASELGETLEVVARDAEVIVTGGQGVRCTCLHAFQTRPTSVGAAEATPYGSAIHIRLGDLVAEQELTVLVAVECDTTNGALENQRALRTEVRLTDRDNVLFRGPMLVEWQVVDAETDRNQHASVPVLMEVATVIASRAQEAALNANRAGQFDRAQAIITESVTAIRALGDFPEVHRIADELAGQALVVNSTMDAREMKEMYALLVNVQRSRTAKGEAKRKATANPRP
ncbi:MAG: hypothetical protein ABIP90_05255 [Vicinamibacterales bacterium]